MADDDKSGVGKFDCHSDPATLGHRWKRWFKSFEFYADGKGLIVNDGTANKTSQRRRALLLHSAGIHVQDIFDTLPDVGETNNYKAAVDALNTYFVPKVNSAIARHAFHQLNQKDDETVRHFGTRLKTAAKDCEYGIDEDNQIRDEILSKCTSHYVKQKLLEAGKTLSLDRTLEIGDQCEEVIGQMRKLSVATEPAMDTPSMGADTVNRVHSYTSRGKPEARKPDTASCYRCGTVGHYGRDSTCPARGKTCAKCQLPDHFAKMCKTKTAKSTNKHVNTITGEQVKGGKVDDEYAF